ncbi:exocyst complex subunit Sec15-like-domain-containing protein, partial [Zychaea mexicana]|uniref:exocyst complex subunit Sec15-like-domain-containing protein n=1 Tax=Zychaea mexicana TaxID=64656 RepID=UPI0022FE3F76
SGSRETRELQQYPSSHLQDLVTFLTNVTNAALLNLPESIKSLLYFDALEHLSHSLKNLLLDPDNRIITEVALRNFDTDVRFMEDFVHQLGDPTILDTFAELRQLIDLAMSDNSEEYLTPQVRSRKYGRVNGRDVIVFFEKLLRDNSTASYTSTPRQKAHRKGMENVARVLRSVHI